MWFKDTYFLKKRTLNFNGELLDLSSPVVMGILNVTPDSFYDGGKYQTEKSILQRTRKIVDEGAIIIDIGAYSSRPGALHISMDEEWTRLQMALSVVRKEFPDLWISVDTFRSEIAIKSVTEYGVNMINDISAGEMDPLMFDAISKLNVPYCIMHMKGTPQDMQTNPIYENVAKEILTYFAEKVESLYQRGVKDVVIDPGFGFGKSLDHNYELLHRLENFQILELPILVGLSRKSMIYKLLDVDPPETLNGTTVLHTIALAKGADILRVHDVKEAVETINLVEKIRTSVYDPSKK